MPYIGSKPSTSFVSMSKQDLTGSSGGSVTLSHAVANANEVALYINNVRQEPTESYTVSGSTLSFNGYTVSASDDIYVIFLGKAIQTTVPPDGSVSTAKIADSAVGTAKIADSAVTSAKLDTNIAVSGTLDVTGAFTSQGIDDNSSSTAMTIDSSGNVGIGNNNPSDFGSLCDNLVIGTTSGENGLTIATGTGNSARIQFADNTSSPFVGAIEYAHSNNHMYFYTNGSQQLKITHGGFIQSPPTASNTVSSSANMFITSGGEFAKSTSSRRFKNTINDATHGLTELLQLRSVTYKGNNDGDIVFGGLIAEEVHDVGLTEFVQYDDEDRPESLHYTHMVALCVKAIQELSAKVTTLETENATQATQIADLISRVTALENS